MGHIVHASEEWQLLSAVHLIFAAQAPAINLADLSGADKDVCLNLLTIFDFEIWLVPDALQEAQALSLAGNTSNLASRALASLLGVFEQYVDDIVKSRGGDNHEAYPKLRVLKDELLQRHASQSGNLLDHARTLKHLVWIGVTLEGLGEIVNAIEVFNRTVNRVSSNTLEDDSVQGLTNEWKEEEVQRVLYYGQFRTNMDVIFTTLVESLGGCGSTHTALVHFTSFRSLKMLLSAGSERRAWRQTLCELDTNEAPNKISGSSHTHKSLCDAIRGPPHQLLRIVCKASGISHSSDEAVPRVRADSKRTISNLLEERAQDRMNATIAPFFSKRKKKIVSVYLAQLLVKLLGCRWVQHDWTAESIFFLPDPTIGDPADLQTPYILASLTPGRIYDDDTEMSDFYFSFVFAFALLLLELELDQSIPITAEDEEDAEEDYPPVYMALSRVFNLQKEDLDDAYILQIVNSCLEFRNRVDSIQHPAFDDDLKFRGAILKFILSPLVQRLQIAHPDVPLGEILDRTPARTATTTHRDFRTQGKSSATPQKRQLADEHRAMHIRSFRTNTDSSLSSQPSGHRHGFDPQRPKHRRDFKIAIICALPIEADAVKSVFDKHWDETGESYGKAPLDQNIYSTGLVGRHNVVLAHMPRMGKETAAVVAANCRFSFEGIKIALVVGICGGVPFPPHGQEILLGDVAISEAIVCYDFGRKYPDRFIRKDGVLDSFGRPTNEITALLNKLKGQWDRKYLQQKTSVYLTTVQERLGQSATYPGSEQDKLFHARYRHKHQQPSACAICPESHNSTDAVCADARVLTCEDLGCDETQLVKRTRLSDIPQTVQSDKYQPMVHIGKFASGSMVMKSGEDRDRIAAEEDVIAFEMEGAGIWDTFPCVIIKGVCDYADSHKSKRWQGYAAATAAASMKAFLESWASNP